MNEKQRGQDAREENGGWDKVRRNEKEDEQKRGVTGKGKGSNTRGKGYNC